MITLHVLACGELFAEVLNALIAFMKQDSFLGLLRITALAGIVMATVGYLKTRDPFIFGKWFACYVFFINLALVPKTTVLIDDIASQTPKLIDNVPVVFALPASLVTTIGYGLAQSYDALLSLPDDLRYTKTGSLFASRLISAARDFHIVNPELKEEMDSYFRACVVGDIRLNHKYSVSDLVRSPNVWELISAKASALRMLPVNSKLVTCAAASQATGTGSLRQKLEKEIQHAYAFYGVNLFGKPNNTSYESLFSSHLTSAFNYYQGLTDTASNIMLQSMMINAINDGIRHYQAFTDSTASVVNQQFSKSQVQHRWSWQIAGLKALWFLPLLHTLLTVLLFGVFPVIVAAATLPGGTRILFGYFQFFISLQFWPVLFAILNAAMTMYGHSQTMEFGELSMVNLDKLSELHQDIAGVAGYMMLLIPFLANGLVSNLGAAFNGLATSMTGHLQGSAMSLAGEAASGSFGLGQTSFYNTTANNFSANKHDSNWSHLHGMHTEQLASGVLKTITGSGDSVFDVSPGMTRAAVSINNSEALSGSLNQAYESSKQTAMNESQHFQSALSNFAHRAVQLSQAQGHDLRLGDGLSQTETGQYSKALSTMSHIARDVAQRLGVSQEEAMQHLASSGLSAHTGISTDRSLLGAIAKRTVGWSAGGDLHLKGERSSTSGDRFHEGMDTSISTRQAADFNQALSYVSHFAKSHHFDDSHSQAAHLSNQMGADLRDAETASHNFDASLSKSERISQAQQYVQSHSAQINTDLNQAFPSFVASRLGEVARDQLFARPGDTASLQQLESLGQDFVAHKRDSIIAEFGAQNHTSGLEAQYQHNVTALDSKGMNIAATYQSSSEAIVKGASEQAVGLDMGHVKQFMQSASQSIQDAGGSINTGGGRIEEMRQESVTVANQGIAKGKDKAKKWL